MKSRSKLGLGILALPVTAFLAGLFTLGAVARGRGVERVAVPASSLIAQRSRCADYADAYAVEIPRQLFPDTGSLAAFAFQRGRLAGETVEELMYTGESPGLTYYISYLSRTSGARSTLVVSTTVHYRRWSGRLYFGVVRPVHRVLTPFMLSQMIRKTEAGARLRRVEETTRAANEAPSNARCNEPGSKKPRHGGASLHSETGLA